MNDINAAGSHCRCISCNYLLCAIKKNEDAAGNYDLKIHCQLARCPENEEIKQSNKYAVDKEAYKRINECVQMLRRCIQLKSKDTNENTERKPDRTGIVRRAVIE